MIGLPKKLLIAFDAVLYVAYNSPSAAVSSKEISENIGLQQRYLENILQHFVHDNIIKGVRGPRGGYVLAREKRKITLGEIVESYYRLEESNNELDSKTTKLGQMVLRPALESISRNITQSMHAITLEELCDRAEVLGIGREGKASMDYSI